MYRVYPNEICKTSFHSYQIARLASEEMELVTGVQVLVVVIGI